MRISFPYFENTPYCIGIMSDSHLHKIFLKFFLGSTPQAVNLVENLYSNKLQTKMITVSKQQRGYKPNVFKDPSRRKGQYIPKAEQDFLDLQERLAKRIAKEDQEKKTTPGKEFTEGFTEEFKSNFSLYGIVKIILALGVIMWILSFFN